MKNVLLILVSVITGLGLSADAGELAVTDTPAAGDLVLFDGSTTAPIFVEANAQAAVQRAARDLADDFTRVTAVKPALEKQLPADQKIHILIGTLGQGQLIDQLAAQGKLDATGISNQWESFILQIVTNPTPQIGRALVIAGSDRRGTIYGIYQLSQMIGVSPWYWWADVPAPKKSRLALRGGEFKQGPPGVKYRGIFINDEDWGLQPWAAKTFDPQQGNIGPKTYAKVFELLLRLRLNLLWPAMHPCSTSFGAIPENAALADKFGVVIGSSHCEPMLYNNVHWNERNHGRWNYASNRNAIHDIWEKTATAHGDYENMWTLGIRGIHDAPMEQPPNGMPDKIQLMSRIFHDQRELLDQHVTKQWGPVAQCFIPYKEVLPIYDAGLSVPDDVTLVWVDDNFGYIRRLSSPAENKRSGGAGIYWHLSYFGHPHSYTWLNTTAPALMWEELHKAWENDTRQFWIINVGDIKPMEIGIDYFSQLAWHPDGLDLGAQREFLHDFAARNFGPAFAQPLTDLLMEFYRLGTVRKPELMERAWAASLTPERAIQLEQDYRNLLAREQSLSATMPPNLRDAYTELAGFPVRVLGDAGLIFMADRKIQENQQPAAHAQEITQLRNDLEKQVAHYNMEVASGKWNRIMPGTVTGKTLTAWSSQVRWPWGEKTPANSTTSPTHPPVSPVWRAAATADRQTGTSSAHWAAIEGLGASGRALALEPANLEASWLVNNTNAPTLEFDFEGQGGDSRALVDFLPTFRLYPGMKLRVAISVDDRAPIVVEIPGSNGEENENGTIRRAAVQDNYVRAQIPLTQLTAGHHVFKIRAIDPGAVIDAVSLP